MGEILIPSKIGRGGSDTNVEAFSAPVSDVGGVFTCDVAEESGNHGSGATEDR